MSELLKHAERELKAAGFFDKDSDYNGELGKNIMELIKVFSDQGHSGFSAGIVSGLFDKLSRFKPLSPLTGNDDEWVEVSDGVFQNRRASHVFKENGQAYDINGQVFVEPNGAAYTGPRSRVGVTFPYTPKTEYVKVDKDGHLLKT
jgi:hypothetical protein